MKDNIASTRDFRNMTSKTHKTVVISLATPSNVEVVPPKADPQHSGPRICAKNFCKRWNFFKLLVVLCACGFTYIYWTVIPYSLQFMNILNPVVSPKHESSWLTYSPSSYSLPPAFTTEVEVNKMERDSENESKTISLVEFQILANTTGVIFISSPAARPTATVNSSRPATNISFKDISRLTSNAASTARSPISSKLTALVADFSLTSSASSKNVNTPPDPKAEILPQHLSSVTLYNHLLDLRTRRSKTKAPETTGVRDIPGSKREPPLYRPDQAKTNVPETTGVTELPGSKWEPPLYRPDQAKTKVPETTGVTELPGSKKEPPLYITAYFRERLGNQMFTYAALLGIARAQNRTPVIRGRTSLAQTFQITHVNNDIAVNGWEHEEESYYATFEPRFMNLTRANKTIIGYFQSWRYFQHNQDEVRREFKFKDDVLEKSKEHVRNLRNNTSDHLLVGVHVRRGDFLNRKNKFLGYGVPKISYFRNAFRQMRELFPRKKFTFLVASDDLRWCRKNLKDPDVMIVREDSAMVHFAVLASCDHVVLSGGTFGWWAAWLSPGVKIYFSGYVAKGTRIHDGFTDEDYYPPGWIGLDN